MGGQSCIGHYYEILRMSKYRFLYLEISGFSSWQNTYLMENLHMTFNQNSVKSLLSTL